MSPFQTQPSLALLLGLGVLAIVTITELPGLASELKRGRGPWAGISLGAIVYALLYGAVLVIVGLLHLVLVMSDTTSRWLRGERPASEP